MSVYRIPALGIPIYISMFERRLQETSLCAHKCRYITMTEEGIIDTKNITDFKGQGNIKSSRHA